MYELLKDLGMKPLFYGNKKGKKPKYYTKFTLDQESEQRDCLIETDWGYIRHVHSINLCQDEVVIESKYSDMKVNMYYKDIEKFDARIYYDDE